MMNTLLPGNGMPRAEPEPLTFQSNSDHYATLPPFKKMSAYQSGTFWWE